MSKDRIDVHEKTFNIAWGDMDALGHVNNVRYFEYFQEARIEWMNELDLDLKQPIGPVIVHIGCTYLKPVIYPATLVLKSAIHSLGNSSFFLDHDIYQNNVLMAQGASKIVWVDYSKNKSVPLPDGIRELFA